MDFEYINIKQIRPFVRFTISNTQLLHSTYVVPLEHRLIYIEQGKASAWIDGKCYKMHKNDIIYISSGTPYRISTEKDTTVFIMYFDLTMENSSYRERIKPISISDENNIPEYLTERYICKYRLKDQKNEISFLCVKENSIITLLLNEIKQYLNKSEITEYVGCIISGFMVSILAKMLDNNLSIIKRESADIVNSVLTYIHSRYNENITLDDLALEFNFHKNYLNLRVKQATGLSIHKYLLKHRLSMAMDFFVYTKMSIAEVAERVGFKDSKAFAVAFKKRYSISPSKVKKQVNLSERS